MASGVLGAALLFASCSKSGVEDSAAMLSRLPSPGRVPKTLVIAIPPATGRAVARMQPLKKYLERKLDHPVRFRVTTSYEELLKLFQTRRVYAANFSPLMYARALQADGVVPLASATTAGAATYLGYFVVAKDSPYSSLYSLRSSRIAWVDPMSASGFLYPYEALLWLGIDPDKFFSEQYFAGDHTKAMRAVISGSAAVAATSSRFVDRGLYTRIPEARELRVVGKTQQIPLDCFAVRKELDRTFGQRLQSILLSLDNDPSLSQLLTETWGFGGFVLPVDERYRPVLGVLERHQQRAAFHSVDGL